MLPVNLLNALKEYALAQRTPLPVPEADTSQKNAPQLDVGQKLQATVQAQVAPNVFKVNVAGQMIQMQLPSFVKSGDTVSLQVVSLQPKLTFSLVNSTPPLSTPEQLGSTARLLSSMSQQAPEKAYVRAAQSTPLWPTAQPPEGKQLAGVLKEALSNSGLFYESHQAQWLEGGRSTAQLMREPQNMSPDQARSVVSSVRTEIPVAAAGGGVSAKAATIEAAKTAVLAEVAGKATAGVGVEGDNVRIVAVGADAAAAPAQSAAHSTEGKTVSIPEHLQPLVQQQLNALETRQMVWQGNVWPGQEMKWEVHEQGPQTPGMDAQRQWVTQLQLDLPNLGVVAATLRFNSAGLSLALDASNEQTRAVLGGARSRLVSALSDAGIPVVSAQVSSGAAQGGQP